MYVLLSLYNYSIYCIVNVKGKNANKYVAYRKEHDFVEKIVQDYRYYMENYL